MSKQVRAILRDRYEADGPMAEIQQGPLLANLRSLEREIGYSSWGAGDPVAVICAWTRLLAHTVAQHTFPQLHKYADDVGRWCFVIQDASDQEMTVACERIHKGILEIDYDDGWPTDKAGNALNSVCLCGDVRDRDRQERRHEVPLAGGGIVSRSGGSSQACREWPRTRWSRISQAWHGSGTSTGRPSRW